MSNWVKYLIYAALGFCVGSFGHAKFAERRLQAEIDQTCQLVGSGTLPDTTKKTWVSVACGARNDGRMEILIGRAVLIHRNVPLGPQDEVVELGIVISAEKSRIYRIGQ